MIIVIINNGSVLVKTSRELLKLDRNSLELCQMSLYVRDYNVYILLLLVEKGNACITVLLNTQSGPHSIGNVCEHVHTSVTPCLAPLNMDARCELGQY
jgi:hypothetical protein